VAKLKAQMTTIRVTRQTANYINDIKRMLELALGRDITQEDVVLMAAQIAYGDQLEKSQNALRVMSETVSVIALSASDSLLT